MDRSPLPSFFLRHRLAQATAAALLGLALAACGSSDDAPAAAQPDTGTTPDTGKPDDGQAVVPTPASIKLAFLGRHEAGVFKKSAAEIPAYDAQSQRAFVVNAQKGKIDVLDMRNPASPVHIGEIDATDIQAGATVNSVAVRNGIIALAIEASPKTAPGFVAFHKASDLSRLSHVQVGALPDMLTFTPDGNTVLVANEGEPSDDYQIDPEGSVGIIDIRDVAKPVVRIAGFSAFNGQAAALREKGVRIYGPDQAASTHVPHLTKDSASPKRPYVVTTVAQDLEPEYIAVSADGKTAWVSLQENNALAKVDIARAEVLDILPLGFKDHGQDGNAMDVTDDGDNKTVIDIRKRPGVWGMYQPDAIAAYQAQGKTYLVSANEGDARAWGEDTKEYFGLKDGVSDSSKGFIEEFRVKHLVHKDGFARRFADDLPAQLHQLAAGAMLDPTVFGYCGAQAGNKPGDCREDEELGRLNISWTQGYKTKADGSPQYYDTSGNASDAGTWLMYDRLYSYGARSFAIWDEDGKLVWDSGAAFEQFLASDDCRLKADRSLPCSTYFNSPHDKEGTIKDRSDAKGPEPEGVELATLGDKTFAFIGLERMGGVMVYDVTNPAAPTFQDYLNTREDWTSDPEAELAKVGDLGPEGLKFIPAADSPNGKPLLIVGYEVSGTTAVYEIEQTF